MARNFYDTLTNHVVAVAGVATHLTTQLTQAQRHAVLVQNTGVDPLFIGGSAVTALNGVRLGVNEHIVIEGSVQVYGISSGNSNVRVIEFQ
jgi:hypothetical protein